MDPRLLITDIGYIFSFILVTATGIFVLFKGRRKTDSITFALTAFSVSIFAISHIIGVNVVDPHLSRQIFTLNIAAMFIAVFNAHCVLSVINKIKEQKAVLIAIYVIAIGLSIIYLVFPDTYYLDSVPKMYLPNYYVPGSLHWITRLVYNILVPIYFFWLLIKEYFVVGRLGDMAEKNRLKYFILALTLGYIFGTTAVPLIFNIPIDPIWSIFMVPLFCIPFAYATVEYELMDIKLVAKRAFLYALLVVAVGIILSGLNFSNNFVTERWTFIPFWGLPLVSALLAVLIGIIVWHRVREADILKYEFINTITHKFRAPLTHVKWASEDLLKENLSEKDIDRVKEIQGSNQKLVELTNLLIDLPESGNTYLYKMERGDISKLVLDCVEAEKARANRKGLDFSFDIKNDISCIFDAFRLKYVINTFLENAISYNRDGGKVRISLLEDGGEVVFSVNSDGIGFSREERSFIFSKFFRTPEARLLDTEGIGIGLFTSKSIIRRHKGKIWAESEGLGKGSIFSFSIPK
jgi:signal transduction histidine kinase